MKYTVKTPFVETETVVSGKNEKFTIIVTAVVTIMVAAVGIFFYFVYKEYPFDQK